MVHCHPMQVCLSVGNKQQTNRNLNYMTVCMFLPEPTRQLISYLRIGLLRQGWEDYSHSHTGMGMKCGKQ